LAAAVAVLALVPGRVALSAQPTPALIEDWRNADYNFSARMMATDLDDDVYVVGDTVVGDYLVINKFSATGALLWQTTYDPAERLRGVWIAVDSGNNPIVLASMITGSGYQPSGWLTLKYDTDGVLLWARGLPGPYRDARRVAIDANDAIYVAGRMWLTNPSANTTLDSVLIKYSPGGATLWTAVFDADSAVDEPYSLAISPDGGRIGVAGISGNLFMALMYDSDGNRLWANTDNDVSAANDLAFGPGNVTYFATGTYFPQDPNPYQMAIAKFDAAGNRLSIKSYGVGDRATRVRVDGQDNVVATGIDQAGYMDWITIKTDADGSLLWSRRYDGGRNNDETPGMLVLDAADAVYVTGKGGPNPSSGTVSYLKGVIVKYGSDGSPQWAVWDPYANGGSIRLGAGNTLASLSWAYLVTTHYTETGLPDLPPNNPSNLSGFAIYSYSSLRWETRLNFTDNADNEFWVEAERCTGSGCTSFTKVAQSLGENATGLTDATIVQGVTYRYRAVARGFMGLSGPSNVIEVVVPPPNPPPAAPSNLTAAMSGANVVLNWQDNSTNESQFYVERCQGVGCASFIGLGASPPNVPTWTDYNAAAGQSYSYRVRAWNLADGYSAYSNPATVVTPGGSPSPPGAPSNLSGQALNTTQIRLTWTNNGANQDSVEIERCRGLICTNFTQIAIVAGTATTYTDSGLAATATYRYRVRAHNSAGDSPYSNVARARTSRR
jgi:Fibronectin type III domain